MASKNNPIERDPASGRPLMRDIARKASRLSPRTAEKKSFKAVAEIPVKKKEAPKEMPVNRSRLPKAKIALVLCGTIILLVFLFIFTKSFSRVRVSVTPRQITSDVDLNLEASSNSAAAISLEVVNAEDTIELDGAIVKTVAGSEKAKGRIVIFNAYSTQAQPLVASTRFEAPVGKIYRIQSNVAVPGGKIENGKLVPGQLEVTVYADLPGADNNLGLSDFTIPGFKGTAKFEKIYARSKTEILGGSSGGSKIVTQEAINNLLIQAQDNFRRNIKSKIQKDLPEGVHIPENATDVKVTLISADPKVNSIADNVHIKAKVSAQVAVLKKNDIVKALSAKYLNLKNGENVEISNLDGLNFQIVSKNLDQKKITFRISGQAHFVWLFDQALLKKELSAASRQTRQDIFKNYSGIDRAEIIFNPSWFRFFPSDPSKIKVEIGMPQGS